MTGPDERRPHIGEVKGHARWRFFGPESVAWAARVECECGWSQDWSARELREDRGDVWTAVRNHVIATEEDLLRAGESHFLDTNYPVAAPPSQERI